MESGQKYKANQLGSFRTLEFTHKSIENNQLRENRFNHISTSNLSPKCDTAKALKSPDKIEFFISNQSDLLLNNFNDFDKENRELKMKEDSLSSENTDIRKNPVSLGYRKMVIKGKDEKDNIKRLSKEVVEILQGSAVFDTRTEKCDMSTQTITRGFGTKMSQYEENHKLTNETDYIHAK